MGRSVRFLLVAGALLTPLACNNGELAGPTFDPLAITTTSLPNAAPSVAYSQALVATGGGGGNAWVVSVGVLPTGLSLAAGTGVISGTPTGTTETFTVSVTSDDGQSATRELTIAVNPVLSVTTTSLPNAAPTVAYSETLAAAGGSGSSTWSVTVGTLPAGLSLALGTGVISGTPTGGTETFTVQVASGDGQTATQELTITVNAALSVSTTSLPDAVPGAAYSETLAAAGGSGGDTWSVTVGTLPTGLSLDAGTGEISGTPTGSTETFTVEVSSDDGQTATQQLTITVNPTLTITTTSLPNAAPTVAYSETLVATGGAGGDTWSVTVGTLPTGLDLTAGTGEISGTATGSTETFTVEVATDDGQTASQQLTITVNAALGITTTSLPDASPGVAYGETLAATGGSGGDTWSVTVGTLPTGLSLTAGTGEISGTATGTTETFTVEVASDDGQTASQQLTITVNPTLAITTTSLPNASPTIAYSETLVAMGGTGGDTWSVTIGTLPAGLDLDAGTGEISGTPTGSTETFTVEVSSDDGQTATQQLTITVNATLTITTTSLPNAAPTVPYSETLVATGGTGGDTWSVTVGTLPTGLDLTAGTGEISGTATGSTETFTVEVSSDDGQTATQALTITVNAALSVTTTSLPDASPGVAYSETLAATGGGGGDTWSVTVGTLPTGLSLTAGTGEISGTPTGTTETFTVEVAGDDGQTATQQLTITVNPTLTITTTSLPNAAPTVAYSETLMATGGTGGDTWSVTIGTLPTGLDLDAGTGEISGTPTGSTETFTVEVSSDDGQTATQQLTITVNATLTITTTSLPNAAPTVAYSETLAATGGGGGNTWSVTVGTLPTGLDLTAGTGEISGTPTGATETFTVEVASDDGQTATQELTITVNAALSITTTSLPDAITTTAYGPETLTATGGGGGDTWTVTIGTLPTGLSLTAGAGEISGTPTGTTETFTIEVASDDGQTATQQLTITVIPILTVTTTSLPNGVEGVDYGTQTLQASGGVGGNSWSVTAGVLPTGLGLAAGTGEITGTPTVIESETFTVEVASGTQTAEQELTIVIDPKPVLLPSELCSDNPSYAIASFADVDLENAVSDALGVPPELTCDLVTGLTSLIAATTNIGDILGIQNLTSLTDLQLLGNNFTDISSLADLTSLTTLNLAFNDIGDLSPLGGLTSLAQLFLGSTMASDISSLSTLTSLTELNLADNSITDIGALGGMTSMLFLTLDNNAGLSDISPLLGITGNALDLDGTAVSCADVVDLEASWATVNHSCTP